MINVCLDKLTNSVLPVKEGYKVFKCMKGDSFKPEYYGGKKRIGIWYNSRNWLYRLLDIHKYLHTYEEYGTYEAGFHVFHNISEAGEHGITNFRNNGIIVKVLIEEPICVGVYCHKLVTVARKMKLVEVVNE